MQPTTVFATILLPLLGEMLLLSVKEVIASNGFDSIASNGDNRDLFWANLMAQPRSNGFQIQQPQWMRNQAELNNFHSPPSINENNNKNTAEVNRPYYQVSASTRQIYPNSYRVFKPKPVASSNAEKQDNSKLDSQQQANPQNNKYKNARSGDNVGFDSMVFETPANVEKASNFYIGDDYSPLGYGSHKRANLLKLANQAARGFGRK